jgi:hypothetical protein
VERVFPLPEVFGPEWRVKSAKEGSPTRVDRAGRTIFAPLAKDPASACVRLEQLARVKWDESDDPMSHRDLLLYRSLQTHRASHLLDKSGLDISAGFVTEEVIASFGMLSSEVERLSLLLIADRTDVMSRIQNLPIDDRIAYAFLESKKMIEAEPTQGKVLSVFEWLKTFIHQSEMKACDSKFRQKGRTKPGQGNGGADYDEYFEDAWDEIGEDEELQNIPQEVRNQLPDDDAAETAHKMSHAHTPGFQRWGEMSIHEPPRTQDCMGKFRKHWKSAEEGVFPRYPQRLLVDGRIFAKRVKLPGGTVLIDASGSMSLSAEQVSSIVDAAPGCIVANYSGNHNDGVLRILAKDGRRVSDSLCARPSGGSNVIDYPAMKWAFKQRHPRILVSDFCVTGVGDAGCAGNVAQCHAVAKKGKFFVVPNADEAVKILRRLGKSYKVK